MGERRKRIRRKNMGYRKLILLLITIFITVLLLTKVVVPGTISLSRYVYSAVKSFYLNSKEFYFTSNRMARNIKDAHFESSNWSGSTDYKVDVEMYSRSNTLKKVSKMDISYDLKFEVGIYKYAVKDGKVSYQEEEYFTDATQMDSKYVNLNIEKTTGIIYASADNQDSFSITINPKDNAGFVDNDYVYIKIIANATEPYKETLYGEFCIYVGKAGLNYQIDDSSNTPYLNVVLTNATEEYTVDKDFGAYKAGETIKAETYKELVEANPGVDLSEYFHSMYVDLVFDPNEVVLDTTSNAYIIADKNPAWTSTQEIAKDTASYTYLQRVRVEIEALESQVVKFYKLDVTKDYTYPNNENDPVVSVELV